MFSLKSRSWGVIRPAFALAWLRFVWLAERFGSLSLPWGSKIQNVSDSFGALDEITRFKRCGFLIAVGLSLVAFIRLKLASRGVV